MALEHKYVSLETRGTQSTWGMNRAGALGWAFVTGRKAIKRGHPYWILNVNMKVRPEVRTVVRKLSGGLGFRVGVNSSSWSPTPLTQHTQRG